MAEQNNRNNDGRKPDIREIKNGKTYILLTLNEGIVYKRVQKNDADTYILISDNKFYKPYYIPHKDIIEMWEFACSIALEDFEPNNLNKVNFKSMLLELQQDIKLIKMYIKHD